MGILDPLRYDSYNDVQMRLHGTIIRYKEEPVLAACRGESPTDLFLCLRPLAQKSNSYSIRDIHSSDEDLDVSSAPLGYMNGNMLTFYVQRSPKRKQHQGIYPSDLQVFYEGTSDVPVDPYALAVREPLAMTIKGQYPQGIEALETLFRQKAVVSMAFHRKYALVKDEIGIVKLKHITKTIGWVKPKSNQVIIPDQFSNDIFQRDLSSHGFDVQN